MAVPTRSAHSRSIANRRDAPMVRSGRRRFPPPIVAWRMASKSCALPSVMVGRSSSNSSSMSVATRAASASSSLRVRSIVSTGIERLHARGLAVAAEGDLLDTGLRILQARLAMPLQPVAFLVQLDRLVERRFALLERADDLLE